MKCLLTARFIYLHRTILKLRSLAEICLPSTKQNRLSPLQKKGFSNWLITLWTLNERKITKTLSYVVKFGYAVLTHGHILSCLIGLSEHRDTLHIDQLSCRGTRTETCLDWPVCQHTGTRFVKYWLSCHHKGNISALTGCGVWIVWSAIQSVACWWPAVSQSTSLYPDGWQDCDDVTVHDSDSGHVSTSLLCGL